MMKKCKLTILKTTLQEDLAKEYGVPNLSICPLMKEGQVFYADYAKPEAFVMKHGKLSISMYLHWQMVQRVGTLMIGLTPSIKVWQFVHAMTD